MHTWQLQEAKAKFSELVKHAMRDEPQNITIHGKPAVVVLSQAAYDKLTQPSSSLVTFLRKSPLAGVRLELTRDKSSCRDIDL